MLANISDGNAAIARGRTGSPQISPLESPITVQGDGIMPGFADVNTLRRQSQLRPEPLRGNVPVHILLTPDVSSYPENALASGRGASDHGEGSAMDGIVHVYLAVSVPLYFTNMCMTRFQCCVSQDISP